MYCLIILLHRQLLARATKQYGRDKFLTYQNLGLKNIQMFLNVFEWSSKFMNEWHSNVHFFWMNVVTQKQSFKKHSCFLSECFWMHSCGNFQLQSGVHINTGILTRMKNEENELHQRRVRGGASSHSWLLFLK